MRPPEINMEELKASAPEPSAGPAQNVCPSKKLDRAAVRSQIRQTIGPNTGAASRNCGTPEFQEMLHREFPKGASEWVESVSRRGFLQLMGASLAMAGMTGCTKLPLEPIVPYVRQPENVFPGGLIYATAVTLSGYGSPVLVESHLGRPTRLKATTSIRRVWAEPISSRKRRCSACTTLIARRPSCGWAK